MKENLKYYIGLDIGTSSVGFCATDADYNVINSNGHDLWGVKLFDEAKTAKDRRLKRSSRRNVQRQKERLMLLRGLFEDEVNKVDSNFFNRLKASALWEDDKQSVGIFSRNSLFFDESIDDKKFFKQYPTIYHLRQACLTQPADDIRFLYLVVHNMLKHRGNFLLDSFNVDTSNNSNLVTLFENLQNEIMEDDENEEYYNLSLSKSKSLTQLQKEKLYILDKELSKIHFNIGVLTQKFKDIFEVANQSQVALLKAISGGTVNAKTIFSNLNIETDAKIDNFGVEDEKFEQFVSKTDEIGSKATSIILLAKRIYDKIVFKKILGENTYFCSAMVDKYNLHKNQLKDFKTTIKKFYPQQYDAMFKISNSKLCNYVKYIQGSNYSNSTKDMSSKCSRLDFYKYVKNILNLNTSALYEPAVQAIINSIEEDSFLPKLRTNVNSVIPYQLNKLELEKILEKSQQKYKFLNNVDDTGLTVSEKIISILEYRIPYFVGPLSSNNSKNAWIVKRLDERILPWNIEQVVDYDKCEQEFIKRMQNNCTYLYKEPVLPKCSLLYSEYMVLQQLNNLQINGKKLTLEIKEEILNLFKQNGTLKISTLKDFLKHNGFVLPDEKINISGINEKFDANLQIYKNFNIILNGEIEKYREQVEDIIAHATYISDKNRFEQWLKKSYSNILTNNQIKSIKGLKISDWGKFSKKFLDGIFGVDLKTGEARTIIQIMREEPLNLMEIMAKYEFEALEVEQSNKDLITYNDIQELYCSPAVKRGVWQSVKIVNELQKIIGCKPEKIFIEVTRQSDDKEKEKVTIDRKNKMIKLYKALDKEISFGCDIDELKEQLSAKSSLDSKKLYLYFTQMGKCMYTGEIIDINSLMSNNYDIDHIFPQSVIKDDSLDNLVLVKRQLNSNKSNNVISPIIQSKMKNFWHYLKENDLISTDKLSRLLRTEKLTDEEKKDFVARQMVITNQTAKAVIDLFKSAYNPQSIIYSKAKYVSLFRNCEYKFSFDNNKDALVKTPQFRQSLIKCRDMNDLHHAKDAFLNIFVGNIFNEKYSKKFYLKDNFKYGFNLNNAFIDDVPGILEKEKHLKTIQQTMQSNTPMITFLTREKHGKFYKETIYGVVKHQKDFKHLDEMQSLKTDINQYISGKISRKSSKNPLSQMNKYGYFSDATYSYYVIIQYTQKEKVIKQFVSIPLLDTYNIENDDDLKLVIQRITGQNEFEIISNKINPCTTIKIGCGYFKIAGNTGNSLKLHNLNQLYLESNMNDYFKIVSKALKKEEQELIYEGENIIVAQNRFDEKKLITKQKNLELYQLLVKHLNKAIYRYVSLGELGKKLKSTYDNFNALDCYKQLTTIKGLIDVINGTNGGNLEHVGFGKFMGVIYISKKISDNKPMSLIYQSATGYYTKELKLN